MGINVDVVSVDKALQTGSEEIGRVLPDDLDPRIEQEIEGVGHIYAESTKTGFCLIYVRYADDPPAPLMVYCPLYGSSCQAKAGGDGQIGHTSVAKPGAGTTHGLDGLLLSPCILTLLWSF
ncbi:unnamed protein product [Sphagnum tenellum]